MASKTLLSVLAALLLGSSLTLAALPRPSGFPAVPPLNVKVGEPVPELSLTTLTGQTLTNADLEGKVVLLDFWATWCKPCVMAVPELKALNEDMKGEPFVLLSLSGDKKQPTLERFVKKNGMSWPQYWDKKMDVTFKTFGIHTFPTYIVLDAEGKVVLIRDGWAEKRTDQAIRAAVQQELQKAKDSRKAK